VRSPDDDHPAALDGRRRFADRGLLQGPGHLVVVLDGDRVAEAVELGVGHQRRDADPVCPQPALVALGDATGDHRDRPHPVPAQVLDSRGVEARRIEGDDRHLRLPGGGDGQQVVDVDAPLEDDHTGPLAEQPQGRGLPGGTGRHHEHADHDGVLSCVRQRSGSRRPPRR
jgi:hypothetical protein